MAMHTLYIADDEESMYQGLTTVVDWESMGLELKDAFHSGEELLQQMRNSPADVVLTDIRMREVSGIDIAHYVWDAGMTTRVVLLSGYTEFEYARQAMQYGVRHYLTKPFLMETLQATISDVLRDLDNRRIVIDTAAGTELAPDEPNGPKHALIREALRLIDQKYANDLTLHGLAELLYINPVYLSRLFHEQTGSTYIEHLMHVRVQAAGRLLLETRRPVYEICTRVGYTDIKYFYKVFKGITGLTPSEFRDHAGRTGMSTQR
jgi:two-component system, response regulator YesN